jgi:hypothetical protein
MLVGLNCLRVSEAYGTNSKVSASIADTELFASSGGTTSLLSSRSCRARQGQLTSPSVSDRRAHASPVRRRASRPRRAGSSIALAVFAAQSAVVTTVLLVGPYNKVVRKARIVAALIAFGLLAAACGGGSEPGVASAGSSTTTTTSPPAASPNTNATADHLDALEYAQCMRTHGVPNFPDPTRNSINPIKDFDLQGIDLSSPQYTAADKACSHLLPNGGQRTSADNQQQLANLLKQAHCMRSHGISDYPDPTVSANGSVSPGLLQGGPNSDLNPNNPIFKATAKACGLRLK